MKRKSLIVLGVLLTIIMASFSQNLLASTTTDSAHVKSSHEETHQPVASHGSQSAHKESAASQKSESGHGSAASGDHGKEASHGKVAVKPIPVTLADGETMKILQTDWLKEAKKVHLADEKAKLSGTFWMLIAVVVGLVVLGGILFAGGIFRRFSLNLKLYTSYGCLVLLATLLGITGYLYLSSVNGEAHLGKALLDLDMMASEMNVAQDEFLLHGIENKEYGEKQVAHVEGLIKEYGEDLEAIKGSDYLEASHVDQLHELAEAVSHYSEDFKEVVKAYHEVEEIKEELDELGEQVDEALEGMIHHHQAELDKLEAEGTDLKGIVYQTKLVEHLDAAVILELKVAHDEVGFLLDKHADRVDSMAKNLGLLMGYLKVLEGELQEAEEIERLKKVEEEMATYTERLKSMIRDEAIIQKDTAEMTELLHKAEAIGAGLAHEAEMKADGMEREADIALVVMIILAIVFGTLLSIFIARGISKPIKRIINGLNEGAEQVSSASGQVSSSSQQLADGASEQAASIEETSSSLEEMSSMTKQNAGNANQADNLMKEANQVVGQANDSMSDLTSSMEEISKASEETSKIIKTIDEIAFQTNLLALNAAVEAARAGEAGSGFAVVADEVRNLAMRAADAAKNTAGLIEGTVKKVKDGSELVTRTNEAFNQVAESALKVGELVGEIAAASNEQSQGIEQVNKAVVEMDKVVQTNAANAEESASASEEMNAQAEQMKASVVELMKLVGGSGKGNDRTATSSTKSVYHSTHHALAAPTMEAGGKEEAVHRPKEVKPDAFIPMDDEDFKDF